MNVSDTRLCQFVLAISAVALGTALLMLFFSWQPQSREQARCTCGAAFDVSGIIKALNCDCIDCQCRKPSHQELRHGCCAECKCGKDQEYLTLEGTAPLEEP